MRREVFDGRHDSVWYQYGRAGARRVISKHPLRFTKLNRENRMIT